MRIYLTRHGTIYGPEDPCIIPGRQFDLPITEEGGTQAERLGRFLKSRHIEPLTVLCGDMRRTKRFAEVVMEKAGLPGEPMVEERLADLDYGDWTGMSESEAAFKFGASAYEGWLRHGIWPQNANWAPSEDVVRDEVFSLCEDIASFVGPEGDALVVGSAGRLRYFLTMVPGAFEKRAALGALRMESGALSCISRENGRYSVEFWNRLPEEEPKILKTPDIVWRARA